MPNGKPDPTPRKALVTGGTTGLGESIALQLQADGYEVAVCGRRADKLAAMQARGIHAFVCDVGDMDQVSQMGRAVAGRLRSNSPGARGTRQLRGACDELLRARQVLAAEVPVITFQPGRPLP
jgi:NAD(P)-dependent dehydrogenase (short-subunit alcohol dehydrogenase family)